MLPERLPSVVGGGEVVTGGTIAAGDIVTAEQGELV